MIQSPAGVVHRAGAVAAVLAAAVLAVSGCGSSGGSGTTSSAASSPPPVSTSATSAPAPASSSDAAGSETPGGASSPAGTPADAAVTAAVTKAYTVFLNYKSGVAQSQMYLQHGDKFTAALTAQAKTAASQKLTAKVVKVVLLSPNSANVTFTLLGNGEPLLGNTPGQAAKENGTWKVAAVTFCGLVSIQGTPPAACNDKSITALPK